MILLPLKPALEDFPLAASSGLGCSYSSSYIILTMSKRWQRATMNQSETIYIEQLPVWIVSWLSAFYS